MKSAAPKRILLAVSGMSPQIITETLFGLIHRPEPWIPDEIHLITTEDGREQARLQLLEKGALQQFLQDYPLPTTPDFGLHTIHVIYMNEGKTIADLRTPEENEAAADCIITELRKFTGDSTTELHVSLAGGRKTMGFYVGYALSLFGRDQDRLSHVLVSPEYESLPDFFYPTPPERSCSVRSRDGKRLLDASKAQVWLAEIPFVRLRHFLPEDNLVTHMSFREVISLVEKATMIPSIRLNDEELSVVAHGEEISMSRRDYVFYRVFIDRCLAGALPYRPSPKDAPGDMEMAKTYLAMLSHFDGADAQTKQALKGGMERGYFDQAKTRIRKAFNRVLGPTLSKHYEIILTGRNANSLILKPHQIKLERAGK